MRSLLDRILEWENIQRAMKRVCANKGSSGVDGMKVEELNLYISDHWKEIEQAIRERRYKPQPVERVEIPKENGGVRKLGIPTVVDRMMLEYFNDGSIWVVDIDLEKFFDTVPQDRLMSIINRTIHDGDTESLIRKYLQAGVMVNGEYEETPSGTPQGGNLSPLLSNIMLNELDKELEVRGLKFTRYADDCVIVVGSSAAAKRVMYSITDWIERKLGLKVNAEKTCITRPTKLKYLGFGFWKDHEGNWRARPHEKSVAKFKRRLKQLCCRRRSIDVDYRLKKLNEVIRGWINYFALADMKTAMARIDEHLRTLMRVIIWKQWKVPTKRKWGLQKLGVPEWLANKTSQWGDHYIFIATKSCLKRAVSKEILTRRGLVSCLDYYMNQHALKLNRTAGCRTARPVV